MGSPVVSPDKIMPIYKKFVVGSDPTSPSHRGSAFGLRMDVGLKRTSSQANKPMAPMMRNHEESRETSYRDLRVR